MALLIALRDEFGNVCSPQQTAASEISVADVKLIKGDIDPKFLSMITRISRVDFYPGIIYTHQVVLSTEQAVHVRLDLMLGGQKLQEAQVEILNSVPRIIMILAEATRGPDKRKTRDPEPCIPESWIPQPLNTASL